MSTIVLIGYRGTGKSTVARLVAQRLSQAVVDSDVEIEKRAGKTIKLIFEEDGEPRFRELEVEVIRDLAQQANIVLALGGGAVMRDENQDAIAKAQVFWLRAAAQTIHARVALDAKTNDQRPKLTSGGGITEIKTLLALREPVYEACADFVVDTDGKLPERVADEVVYLLVGEGS